MPPTPHNPLYFTDISCPTHGLAADVFEENECFGFLTSRPSSAPSHAPSHAPTRLLHTYRPTAFEPDMLPQGGGGSPKAQNLGEIIGVAISGLLILVVCACCLCAARATAVSRFHSNAQQADEMQRVESLWKNLDGKQKTAPVTQSPMHVQSPTQSRAQV